MHMCLHALTCAAFFSRAARNGRPRPPAPPPDSAFQPRANSTGLPGRSVGGAARRCLRQWGAKSGRILPGRGEVRNMGCPARKGRISVLSRRAFRARRDKTGVPVFPGLFPGSLGTPIDLPPRAHVVGSDFAWTVASPVPARQRGGTRPGCVSDMPRELLPRGAASPPDLR
jgi:hypothetical protein